jgi:imidazolonepropionase-like amidohydrolase
VTSGSRLARFASAALFALLVFGSGLAGPADAADEPIPGRMAIRAGRVIPVVGAPIDDGIILIRDGKIEAVGPASKISVPKGYALRHYPNGFVTPGWVELHAHVAGSDLNDMVYPTNPELRNLDNIVPDNFQLRAARAGGVTTMLFIPGSGTNLSGFGTLVKTAGATVEEMTVQFPGAMKIAQLGNPERNSGDVGKSTMGMNHLIRARLQEAKRYAESWQRWDQEQAGEPPQRDERLENFRGLFAHQFPVIVHTVWVNGVEATKRILHDEMGLDLIVTHATFDSYKAADVLNEAGLAINVGPRLIHYERETGRILGIPQLWKEAGCENLSLNTDCPVVPAEELTTQGSMAVRFGLDETVALEALSIVPARQVGMADRLGSLEPGKDADIVVRDGPPLDIRSAVLLTLVNGKNVYDVAIDRRLF